ncbi:MAG TPA: glycosyltransferase family 4 protein, partial [Solirubrobacteraceae bacterium]
MISDDVAIDDQVDVLALIDHFVLGGAETLLARFAPAAGEAGINLQIACLEDRRGNPAAEPLVELGMPPVNLNLTGPPRLRALRSVRGHIAAVRPQIVHTHLGTSDVLGGVAARSLGIPVVCTIHSSQWEASGVALRRKLVKHCASRIIAVSESARREYLKRGFATERQIVTIHNGVDFVPTPGSGGEVRQELGLAGEDLVVGMVSALRPEKGHDIALGAVRELGTRFPNLRLLIAGQGDLYDELVKRASKLDGVVVVAGLRHDLTRVFDACDVCLQPSRADAFPTSIIEAMAASVPVIATAVGGIPEMISDGRTGVLLAPPPQVDALATALAELLADPERRRRLAQAARQVYLDRFTAGPWVRSTRAL